MSLPSISSHTPGWFPKLIALSSDSLSQSLIQCFEWLSWSESTSLSGRVLDTIIDYRQTSPIKTIRRIEIERLIPRLKRAHIICDPRLIEELLHTHRGAILLDSGFENDLKPLMKKDTMLLCPFSDHRRLRTPLEKQFHKGQLFKKERLIAQIGLAQKFALNQKNATEMINNIGAYVIETMIGELGFNLTDEELYLLKSLIDGDKLKAGLSTEVKLRLFIRNLIEEKKFSSEGIVATLEKHRTLNDEEKISSIVLMLLAGMHTTQNMIQCFCDAMIRTRHNERIFYEWNHFINNKNVVPESSEFAFLLSEFILKNDFLQACFLETVRLFPIIPDVKRVAKIDFTLGTTQIYAGDEIHLNILAAQRDPKVWGSDNYQFNPARFGDLEDNKKKPPLFDFGLGSQSCLGKHLAEREIKTFVALFCILFGTEQPPTPFSAFDSSYDGFNISLVAERALKLQEETENFKPRLFGIDPSSKLEQLLLKVLQNPLFYQLLAKHSSSSKE